MGSATGLGSTGSALWQLACRCFGASGRSKWGERVRHIILRRDTIVVMLCSVLLCKLAID